MNALYGQDTILSEEERLRAKKLEDESQFFHSEDKGCFLEDERIFRKKHNGKDDICRVRACRTHEVICCHCGWEIGFHYGTPSKMLDKPIDLIRYANQRNIKEQENRESI